MKLSLCLILKWLLGGWVVVKAKIGMEKEGK